MRLLIALMLLVCSLGTRSSLNHRFIVFIHDGTFYKLDPETKQVEWHNELPFKLLSLDMAQPPTNESENETKKIFIPTVDGDFLYLEHSLYNKYSKQILVPREDVQHLLDMCFDSKPQEKYFVYQKLEYFVLNTKNGQYNQLEEFLNQKSIFNKSVHAIMMVAKKLLKQLNSQMQVKWSVISSKIALVDVNSFASSPKISQTHKEHPKYSFVRIDPKTIQIIDQHKNTIFDIQASSSIMNIFSQDLKTHQFSKILIKNSSHRHPKLLAIQQLKPQRDNRLISLQEGHFPQSNKFSNSETLDNLQICLKAHKILKEANQLNQASIIGTKPNIFFDRKFDSSNLDIQSLKQFNPDQLPTLPFSGDRPLGRIIISKEQPYVYIFLIVIILCSGMMFYRFKVNKLWQQISQMQNITDENIKKITAKLGQYQNVGKQLKKMYEVHWQKIIYKNQLYVVFQGRFLNQSIQVFMLPLKGFDLVDIQHKLNILLNCSHKYISKLYYYTINDDSLLIFSESSSGYKKLNNIGQTDSQIFQKINKNDEENKCNIKIIMESVYQLLNSKIQITSFSEQSVLISESLQVKINIIPSILKKNNQQEDKRYKQIGTSTLRVDIVKIIHKMAHKGQQFDLMKFQKEKNSQQQQNSFLKDFYDHFLLSEHNPEDLQALRSAEKHPFLWDPKQKMLFVCDFSNYVETCIDDQKLSKMELHCKNLQVLPFPWNIHLHPALAKQLNNYRKYDFYSARDLIRLIRNKLSHFHEIPKQTRVFVGKTPELFVQYFLEKFPKLLSFMYVYATKKKWKLSANQ